MKTSHRALLPLFALLTACAATPDASPDDDAEVTSAEQELGASGLQRQTYRGRVDAGGRTLGIEVELATTRTVSQMKYCGKYEDSGKLYAGAAVTAGYDRPAGTITTRVRDAAGRVVAQESRTFIGLSAYDGNTLVPEVECTRDARIVRRTPVRELTALVMNTSIPGAVAKVAGGDVWVNPSYGGPTVEYVSFRGVARFATTEAGTSGPRPFGGPGEELDFARGTLSLETQPEIQLQIGWDVDALHAKKTAYVTLRK